MGLQVSRIVLRNVSGNAHCFLVLFKAEADPDRIFAAADADMHGFRLFSLFFSRLGQIADKVAAFVFVGVEGELHFRLFLFGHAVQLLNLFIDFSDQVLILAGSLYNRLKGFLGQQFFRAVQDQFHKLCIGHVDGRLCRKLQIIHGKIAGLDFTFLFFKRLHRLLNDFGKVFGDLLLVQVLQAAHSGGSLGHGCLHLLLESLYGFRGYRDDLAAQQG